MQAVCETAKPQAGKDSFLFRPVEFMEFSSDKPVDDIFRVVFYTFLVRISLAENIQGYRLRLFQCQRFIQSQVGDDGDGSLFAGIVGVADDIVLAMG